MIVFFGRHFILDGAKAGNHSRRHLSFEPKPPHHFLPHGVERSGKSPPSVFRTDADVRAIEPGPIRLVRSEPAALDDLAEGVVHMIEIEVETQSCGCAHHAIAIQGDELAVVEQLHVLQVVKTLEALLLGERGKTGALQLFELNGKFRASMRDHQAVSKFSIIPAHRGFRKYFTRNMQSNINSPILELPRHLQS